MKIYNVGVLDRSSIYFHTASNIAKEIFFYLLCTGNYYCDSTYIVDRKNYNSFLLLYVIEGKGFMRQNEEEIELQKGDFVFLDCYEPHTYGSRNGWEIHWIHFDGCLARDYYNHIVGQSGNRISLKDGMLAQRSMQKIYDMFANKETPNEAVISKEIINLLTDLILATSSQSKNNTRVYVVDEIISYISENIHLPLTLNELAERAYFSPYYFTRLFKKETGYTPHQYIILSRVNRAKFYLKTTELSSKKIAFSCGFANESSFCTTFKKIVGISPNTYRNTGEQEI